MVIRSVAMLLAALALAVSVSALPRFASRTGARCQSCHVNPAGKGMRTAFGAAYGREQVPMPMYKDDVDIDDFSPNLTDNVSLGLDYRTLFFYDEKTSSSSFFQMQGNLYLDLRLNKKVRVYLDKGLYSGFEVFGLARVLPLNGYLKLGKFVPAYGLRTDDHNAFIRGGQTPFDAGQFSGLLPGYPRGLSFGERAEDTGLEAGVAPGDFTLIGGVFNGSPGGGLNGTTGLKNKTFALRGDVSFGFEPVNLNVGGSFYHRPSLGTSGKLTYYGGFGSVTVLNIITLTTELDYVSSSTAGSEVTGMIVFNELSYLLLQGIDLKLGYEFYDPNVDKRDGTFTRLTIGAEFFPVSGVEVRPLYRVNLEEPQEINNNQLQVLFHLYM